MTRDKYKYTSNQIKWLSLNVPNSTFSKVAHLFNLKFGADKSIHSISMFCSRHNIRVGYKYLNRPRTITIKRLHTPHQKRKTIRVYGNNRYKVQKRMYCRLHNINEFPKGYSLFFIDNNSRNTAIDNMEIISVEELGTIAGRHWNSNNNAEFRKTCLMLVKLERNEYENSKTKMYRLSDEEEKIPTKEFRRGLGELRIDWGSSAL